MQSAYQHINLKNMKTKYKISYSAFFALFIFSFIFSGCFDMKREIKMNPDGTGLENMYITLDKDFFDKMQMLVASDKTGRWKGKLDTVNDNGWLENGIRNEIQKVGGTSIKELVVTVNPDGSKQIYMQYSFDDPTVWVKIIKAGLFAWTNELPVQFSTIKFQDDNGNLTFKHTTRKAERSFDDENMHSIFSSVYPGKRVTTTIEFPFEVKESNAMSQSGNMLTYEMTLEDAIRNSHTDTAALVKDPELALTYAERVDRTIGRVSQKDNPLIRVQVYNRNQEPVKIGTGVVLKDGLLVTNFVLMNLIEGAGYFSVILPTDSLAGIDDMTEKDLDQKQDLVFLRFGSPDKFKPIKYASVASVKYGDKVKLFYYPNTLSSVVYSMDAQISATKKWTSKTSVIEIKPNKPISLEGGAVFTEGGDFLGMITVAYDGEVGKIYLVPAEYIKNVMPR
jgi:hypothetical protein